MLYKISKAPIDNIFRPKAFWRTEDWKSSSTSMKPGYIYDEVLYAGEFDEVNIHLLPNIKRLRLWNAGSVYMNLEKVSVYANANTKALIIADESHKKRVNEFCPTIHYFHHEGFELVPSNEWVCRQPKTPIKSEIITMEEAIKRWNIDIQYVNDYEAFKLKLTNNHIDYCEQT